VLAARYARNNVKIARATPGDLDVIPVQVLAY
jgi:hypothetical protein